jgi:polynucleotide 5'-kinase involved in rRNA processing
LEQAASSCPSVLIDTSGFIEGTDGRVFKEYKIDLLAPDLVFALQRADELEPVLQGVSHQERPVIVRLPVPAGVRVRDMETRAAWRAARFADYFTGSVDHEIPLSEVGLRATRYMADLSNQALTNRIVSLRDSSGRDLALGIILEVRRKEGTLLIRTPLTEDAPVSTVMLGEAVSPL